MGSSPHGTTRGAVPMGGDREESGGGGWAKWLLPLLLLLAVVAAIIVMTSEGGRGADGPPAPSTPSASSSSAKAKASKPKAAAPPAADLAVGGTALFPVEPGSLESFVGKTASGTGLTVQAVNPKEGFWVGTSRTDRVYVEFGGRVGESEEGAFTPKVGSKVDVTGEMRPSPVHPVPALNLEPADAEVVKRDGGFLNADAVKRVG